MGTPIKNYPAKELLQYLKYWFSFCLMNPDSFHNIYFKSIDIILCYISQMQLIPIANIDTLSAVIDNIAGHKVNMITDNSVIVALEAHEATLFYGLSDLLEEWASSSMGTNCPLLHTPYLLRHSQWYIKRAQCALIKLK